MTRKKVKLAFIANDSSRKATFKKRKKGLMKKVNELSTLCGITACAIIYSPYDINPEVWPSNSGVQRVIGEFRTLPEMDQHKKMVDQETFLRQRIAKATEHLKKQRKENRELEMTEVMFHCLTGRMGMFHLNIMDLNDLGYLIDQNLKDVNRRLEILENSGIEVGESSNAAPAKAEGTTEGVGTIRVVADTTTPAAMVSEAGSPSSPAATATFFNHVQQHQYQHQPHQPFRYPPAPHVGFYEQSRNMNLSENLNQTQQQWFMEMMNNPEHMSYMAEQMGFTLMDDNHHNRNHHHHHHQPHQRVSGDSFTAPPAISSSIISVTTNRINNYQPQPHQQIHRESSTAPASASSSSVIPITDLNLTNNIWFR